MPAVLASLRRPQASVFVALVVLLVSTAPPAPAAAPGGGARTTLAVSGELVTVVGDDFARDRAVTVTSLRLHDGTEIPLDAGALGSLPTHGRFSGTVRVPPGVPSNAAALAERGTPVSVVEATISAVPSAAPTPSAHHAYVAIMTNAGDFGATNAQLGALVDEITGFWVGQSAGFITGFDRPATQTFASAHTNATDDCGLSNGSRGEVWDEAEALFPGVDFLGAPNHLLVLVPGECAVGASAVGWGHIGSSISSGGEVIATAEDYAKLVIGHELGHNLSLGHANGSLGGEYADWYSVMGSAIGGSDVHDLPVLGSAQRSYLGLLQPAETVHLSLPQGQADISSTHTLTPRGSGSGLRTVRVEDPESGEVYYLDYRSGTGVEADTFYQDGTWSGRRLGPGLTVVRTSDTRASTLQQVDVSSVRRDTVRPGETFTSDTGAVTVTVTAMTGTTLDATVTLATDLPAFPSPPAPVITGTPEVHEMLEVDLGTWSDDAYHEVRWLIDGEVLLDWDAAPYDSTFLVLGPEHRGAVIQARVTTRSFDVSHRPITQTSSTVGPVVQRVAVNAPYLVFNDPEVGTPFQALAGSAFPADATLTYQWNAAGVPIPGATALTYTPVAADVGKVLTITATGTKDGYEAGTATSPASLPVAAGPVPALPAGTPTVSGTARLGGTLTAQAGTWPAGTSLAYAWLRNGSTIPGATATTYQPGVADVGARLRVHVTGSKSGYAPSSATSAQTSPVAPGTLVARKPTISGKAKVGKKLKASTGSWSPGTKFAFQWLLNGKVVRGATAASWKLPASAKGKKVSVRVTGSKLGYATTTKTSARTGKVK